MPLGESQTISNKKLFSIGEVSRLKGITVKALRFYQKIGLLAPCTVNPDSGYRYYSSEQLVLMDIIKAMRAVDVSPREIREVLAGKSTPHLLKFLDAQRERTERKIRDLRRTARVISGVQDAISRALSITAEKGVYTRSIPRRVIAALPCRGLSTVEDALLEFSRLDRILERRGLTSTYETGIILEQDDKGMGFPTALFAVVKAGEGSVRSGLQSLPAGDYVCVCMDGKTAVEQGKRITRHLTRNRLTPLLILQVELLNDVFSADSGTVELQILVRPAGRATGMFGRRRPPKARTA